MNQLTLWRVYRSRDRFQCDLGRTSRIIDADSSVLRVPKLRSPGLLDGTG
jgi:hypothetical protein